MCLWYKFIPAYLKRQTIEGKRKGKETFHSLLLVDLDEGIPNSLVLHDDTWEDPLSLVFFWLWNKTIKP